MVRIPHRMIVHAKSAILDYGLRVKRESHSRNLQSLLQTFHPFGENILEVSFLAAYSFYLITFFDFSLQDGNSRYRMRPRNTPSKILARSAPTSNGMVFVSPSARNCQFIIYVYMHNVVTVVGVISDILERARVRIIYVTHKCSTAFLKDDYMNAQQRHTHSTPPPLPSQTPHEHIDDPAHSHKHIVRSKKKSLFLRMIKVNKTIYYISTV